MGHLRLETPAEAGVLHLGEINAKSAHGFRAYRVRLATAGPNSSLGQALFSRQAPFSVARREEAIAHACWEQSDQRLIPLAPSPASRRDVVDLTRLNDDGRQQMTTMTCMASASFRIPAMSGVFTLGLVLLASVTAGAQTRACVGDHATTTISAIVAASLQRSSLAVTPDGTRSQQRVTRRSSSTA
jgi:hypothetical protein